MIYDFCEIEFHYSGKVKANFGLFEFTGFNYPKGLLFISRAYKGINLYWNNRTNCLTISGSLAFYFQGHNFKCDANALQIGYDFLSSAIGINLFGAVVTAFEVGELLATTYKPETIFTTHTSIKGMKTKPYEFGKWFEDKVLRVKLYDAGKRIKEMIPKNIRNQLQTEFGYQPNVNYVRIENHYKKPEIRFKQCLKVTDLVSIPFQDTVKEDLITTYQSIVKTPAITMPEHLGKPSTSDLYLIALEDLCMKCGLSVEDKINSLISNCEILNKEDIKARKRKIKIDLKRLSTNQCDFDMSEQLILKLK